MSCNGIRMTLYENSSQRRSPPGRGRSEEHTSELQSQSNLACRLLLEKKKQTTGLKSLSIYAIEIILRLVLTPFLGIPAIFIRLGLGLATFLLRRRRTKWEKIKPLMT